MYLWLAVFWLQPHKEERFLFPVYPLICLAAALSVDTIQKLWYAFLVRVHVRHYLDHTQWISYLFLAVTTLLSFSRIVALYQNYHASMDIWMNLNHLSHSEDYFFAGKVCFYSMQHTFSKVKCQNPNSKVKIDQLQMLACGKQILIVFLPS